MNAFTSINSKYNLAMHVEIVQLDLTGTNLTDDMGRSFLMISRACLYLISWSCCVKLSWTMRYCLTLMSHQASSANILFLSPWLTLQQQAMKEFLAYVWELERQLKVGRSASSASALVCWESGLWRRSCWDIWSAKARLTLFKIWSMCVTQHSANPLL